jgi:hypothetical protein
MMHILATLAGLFWSATHLGGCALVFRLWRTEGQRLYMWFGLSWLCMAAWGITAGIDGAVVYAFNAVVLPIAGAVFGMLALHATARFVRRRIVTVRTTQNGDLMVGGFGRLDLDDDTPTLVGGRAHR